MKFLSDKKNLYFTGTYLSLFAFMICSATEWDIGIALFKVLAIILFGVFLFRENSADEKSARQNVDFEKSIMVFVVLLFNVFMLQRGKMQGEYEILNIVCGSSLIIMGIAYYVCYHEQNSIKKWFSENKLILSVIICFILMSIEVINIWPMWDAKQYYSSFLSVVKNFNADFSGMYGLRMCGHSSEGYSLWLMLFQLFHEGLETVHIADIILASISIYAYYQILRKILEKKYSNKVTVLATLPYAFSPFVMGTIGNFSLDNAAMYFVVIFIACSLYHKECLELIFAFLFCFTKEPSLICYVTYIIVKIICDYLSENRFHLLKMMKFGFGNIKNYIYAIPPILWMILYKLNQGSGWMSEENITRDDSGFNCFGISSDVISTKVKQVFTLNFNWLFWIAIILGVIILIIKKIKKIKTQNEICKIIIPISVMGISLIAFECVYITYILPRYLVPALPALYLSATSVFGTVKKKVFYAWNILLSVLLLAQCFFVIDPVMSKVYPTRQIGDDVNSVVYETGNHMRFDDHIVYNRENIYWPQVFSKVLENAGYNGNMLIVVPTKLNSQYELIGGGIWNKGTGKLEYLDKELVGEQRVRLRTCTTENMEQTIESSGITNILYMIPKWDEINNSIITDSANASKNIVKQGKVDYRGYTVQYYVMNIQYKFPLENGNYTISPKLESTLKLCTDGHQQRPYLKEEGESIKVSATNTSYKLIFEQSGVALDIPGCKISSDGRVQTYELNNTVAQRWILEEINGYYMICWDNYALTYDLENNFLWMTPKTGEDNQLWSFTQ